MGGTLGGCLVPRSGNSNVSSRAEQNWSPMMLALLRLSEKVSPSFFKGGKTCVCPDGFKFQKRFRFLL